MSRSAFKQWISARLTQPPGPGTGLNALSATFQLAVSELLRMRMSQRVDEEAMTGALLGALTSFATIGAHGYGSEASPGCSWIRYTKSGSTQSSETITGADFALALVSGPRTRLMIVQAKRAKGSLQNPTFDVHQIRKDSKRPSGQPQFKRLLAYYRLVAARLGLAGRSINHAHWVHYLVYSPEDFYCCALDQLASVQAEYKTGAPAPILLTTVKIRSLFWLLTDGANKPMGQASPLKGWIEFDTTHLAKLAASLGAFIDLYVATATPGPQPEIKLAEKSGSEAPRDLAEVMAAQVLRRQEELNSLDGAAQISPPRPRRRP